MPAKASADASLAIRVRFVAAQLSPTRQVSLSTGIHLTATYGFIPKYLSQPVKSHIFSGDLADCEKAKRIGSRTGLTALSAP